MFFFFLDRDFDRELGEFIVDPKLQADCNRVEKQINMFRKAFPLERLCRMTLVDYRDPAEGRNDFCHWITSKTSLVVGRLDRSKAIVDAVRFDKNVSDWHGNDRRFHEHILDPLCRFVHSRGKEIDPVFENYFGAEMFLKLLVLYYPDSFISIPHVSWQDKIISAFGLEHSKNAYARNQAIYDFYRDRINCVRRDLPASAFIAFLNDYLGLQNRYDDYTKYLTNIEGMSEKTVFELAKDMRQLSRLLVGFGACKKSQLTEQSFWNSSWDTKTVIQCNLGGGGKISPRKISEYDKARYYYQKSLAYRNGYVVSNSPFLVAQEPLTKHWVRPVKLDGPRDRLASAATADDVVRELCESAKERPYARHYTTFSAFLSITDNSAIWMFRLTRGDDPNMNDQLEWQRLGDATYWKRTFISSFSCVHDESAAMWGLYGKPNNEAIRLSFNNEAIGDWLSSFKSTKSLPEVELATKDGGEAKHFQVAWDDLEIFWGDVLYGGNVSSSSAKSTGYVLHRKYLPKKAFQAFNPPIDKAASMTGFIKSIDWEYEDECRLIVRIKPTAVMPEGRSLTDVKYVYIPIPAAVLSKASYMIGPCVPDKLRSIVESKLIERVQQVLVEDSKYTGNLKFR